MTEVVVVGGGVVGSSAAYRLARDGVRVTLVDRADQGQATAAGAGIVAPGTTLRELPEFEALAFAAVGAYPDLLARLAEDGQPETGYAVVGALVVAVDEVEAAYLPEVMARFGERRAAGMPNMGEISRLTSVEAKAFFPPLTDVAWAIYHPEAARVDGRLLRDSLRRAAELRGAAMVQGSADLVREGDRVTGVRVDGRTLACDAVIVAGGAWSSALGEALGVTIPVYPQRGQIMHLTMPETETSRWPIVLGFHSHYLLTFPRDRVVAGATREDEAGYDYRMTAGGVHEALGEALRVAPGLAGATLSEVRIGFRPASADGLPILGRIPGVANAYLATGHGPSGLQLGPYSGAVVADLLQGKPASVDLTPFAVERFGR